MHSTSSTRGAASSSILRWSNSSSSASACFPIGSVVELNSGEVAVVIAQNLVRRMQPRIMIVKDANGNPYVPYKMMDLMKEHKFKPDEPYRILRSLEYDSVKIDPRELFL
jgi:hypothetical protein